MISDLFDDDTRGGATALFAIGPVIGPVIGPIAGGFLAEECGWRWVSRDEEAHVLVKHF